MRKRRKGNSKHYAFSPAPYIMVHLSYEEIKAAYGPESSCKTLTDALETFREDMFREADFRGYKEDALFSPTMALYTDWIRKLWENYDEEGSMGSQDPDNDGGRDDSSELEERDAAAGTREA